MYRCQLSDKSFSVIGGLSVIMEIAVFGFFLLDLMLVSSEAKFEE